MSSNVRIGTALLTLSFLVAMPACSSDSSNSSSATVAPSVVADSIADEPSTEAPAPAPDASTSSPSAEPADCSADQQAGIDAESLSRSAIVLFSADSKSGVSYKDITAATTMTIQADGTLSPATLTVSVGQVFGIMPAEGADIDAVKIGCADAQTLLPGSPAGFVIKAPGTYMISLEIAGTALGTVIVQ